MKQIIKYSLILPILLLMGCSDFLETHPYSSTVVENYYKTEADAEIALTGCYSVLSTPVVQGEWRRGMFNTLMQSMLDAGTDEAILRDGLTDQDMAPLATGAYTAQSLAFEKNWSFAYVGISRVNVLLDHLPNIPMGETRKVEIEGEARFLRGLYYMYLGMCYGGVPLYNSSKGDPLEPRATLENTFKFVIEDFKFAYANLPNRSIKQRRANKWSAAGLLTKTYCYLASCRKYNVGQNLNFELNSFQWVDADEYYKQAKIISDIIIESSGYKLTENYDNLFREASQIRQDEECLFVVQSSITPGNTDYLLMLYYLSPVGVDAGGGYGWYRPTGELYYNTYNENDLRRTHNVGGGIKISEATVKVADRIRYYEPAQTTPKSDTYCITKFRPQDPNTKSLSKTNYTGDYPIIRLADIILLNAEAYYHEGNETKARERLTDVRKRIAWETLGGSAPKVEILDNVYKRANFINELVAERSRELCFEGQRRIDLIRFGKIKSTIMSLSDGKSTVNPATWNKVVPALQANWTNAEHKIWFPIPINEVYTNPNLVQNPYYETRK